METIIAFYHGIFSAPFDFNVRYSLFYMFYMFCTVAIAFAVWLSRGRPDTFLTWLVPSRVYRHKSNILDIKLFLASRLFMAFGIFSAVLFPSTVAYALLMYLGGLISQCRQQAGAEPSLLRLSSLWQRISVSTGRTERITSGKSYGRSMRFTIRRMF